MAPRAKRHLGVVRFSAFGDVVLLHSVLAQALEHETDHVNGLLYVDRLDAKTDLVKLEPAGARARDGDD